MSFCFLFFWGKMAGMMSACEKIRSAQRLLRIQLGFLQPLIDRCPSHRLSLTGLIQLFSLKAKSNSSLDALPAVHPLLCARRLCACHRPISRSHLVYLVCVFHRSHLKGCFCGSLQSAVLPARKFLQSRLKLVFSVSFFQLLFFSFSQPM